MANHYYIFSEVPFFNNKADKNTWDFVSGTGIDLNQLCTSKAPTINEIKQALVEYGFETKELVNQHDRIELSASQSSGDGLWLIFTNVKDENAPVDTFEVGRGSNPDGIINFVKFLASSHGNFLYYCDAGAMSLITKDKPVEQIRNEMYFN